MCMNNVVYITMVLTASHLFIHKMVINVDYSLKIALFKMYKIVYSLALIFY